MAAVLFVLAGFVAAGLAQPSAQSSVLYRVTAESVLTLSPSDGTWQPILAALQGTFFLARQVSPLDWEVFEVADLVFEAQTQDGPLRITGSGIYRQGGRGPIVRRLQLHVIIDGRSVALDSGDMPPGDWPVIDMDLKGKADNSVGTYGLHLVAVPELMRWHYALIDGSTFLDDCAVCDHLPIYWPLRGGFDLVLIDENPLFKRYHLFDVQFDAGTPGAPQYKLTGEGTYRQGGEVALTQNLELKLRVLASQETRSVTLTNRNQPLERHWPMFSAASDEVGGTDFSTYRIELRAAPFREIWFSTTHGFTPGTEPVPPPVRGAGDVLANTGRLVRSNADLVRQLGFEPGTSDLGIDALDVAPGGEVLFSLNQENYSESLGPVSAGELLSDRGRIVERNAGLLNRFGFMPPTPDLGLDAVHVADAGEVLFSITDAAFSERLGLLLSPGDLLSNRGLVWRSTAQLLAAFHPKTDWKECGLDAVFVWPHGEVWFSLERGFDDDFLGPISDGDLISDQGYVVFKNLDLLSPFQPLEEMANFGLDGVLVVTDAAPSPPSFKLAGQCAGADGKSFLLQWNAQGRVFQVERTSDLRIPFEPLSPLQMENLFLDSAPLAGQAFYRIRQW